MAPFPALSLPHFCACNTEQSVKMPPALPSYSHPDNGPPPPGLSIPPDTSSLSGMEENQPPATDEVDLQVYLDLWQEVLANTTEPLDEGDEALVSGVVTENDSRGTLRDHLRSLKMFEVNGPQRTLFSALQAAIDKQCWPSIPRIRETHLVNSEKFPFPPDILLGCTVRSYALDQQMGTLKLLTMRGIVTIKILTHLVGSIGIDPNFKHALNTVCTGGQKKIIHKASFARRKGNGSNASQFLVFGLQFGSMKEMGFIFCKDPGEPWSGPTGHVTLTYSPSMVDDALNPSATAKKFCCPYCFNGYTTKDGLVNHFHKSFKDTPDSDNKHPQEEMIEFIRNCLSRKQISQSRRAEAARPGFSEMDGKPVKL